MPTPTMHKTEKQAERVVLVAVAPAQVDFDRHTSLEELALLAHTAGGEVVGRMTQHLDRPHPGHYLGKGKVDELKAYVAEVGATLVLCDDELTATQFRNLEESLDVTVLDRTLVILDIFTRNAHSAEGKAQVELAQLKYRSSRLSGLGKQLSRLGGGIGTRGPGEKKLETDRRHIRRRIDQLGKELADIATKRAVQRATRQKSAVPVIALVGYTNAGKSTLMNALTDADVLVENKLFATLDTTIRKMMLPGGTPALLSDTVGFIDKLPHHLVQAFRATLEELQYATLLVHVVDISNPNYREQMAVVTETLASLKLDKPVIVAYNKADLTAPLAETVEGAEAADSGGAPDASQGIHLSAKKKYNLTKFLSLCEDKMKANAQ